MADTPEALTYAEAIRARTAVMHYIGWLSESVVSPSDSTTHIDTYVTLANKLNDQAVWWCSTECYRADEGHDDEREER